MIKPANATYKFIKVTTDVDGGRVETEVASGLGWLEDEARWRVVEGETKVVANAVLYVWDEPPEGLEGGVCEVNGKRRMISAIERYTDLGATFHHAEVLLR